MITINMSSLIKEAQFIHDEIKRCLLAGVEVTLDFEGLEVCPSCFLNVAIGQLYGDSRVNKDNLKIKNIQPEDTKTLKLVVENAKRFFKEKDILVGAVA
ncbi:MAG: STAS-like domain-containing protein [Candidatus Omnitrophota bacterium]